MTIDALADLGLGVGDIIDDEEKRRLEKRVIEHEARGYCLRVLSARARTSAQLREGLEKRDYPEKVIDKTIGWLSEVSLIDDGAYARSICEGAIASGYGRRRAEEKLRRAGILEESKAIIEEIFSGHREDERVKELLQKRYPQGMTPSEGRRAQQWLVRRGFSFPAAREGCEGLIVEDGSESEGRSLDEAIDLLEKGGYTDLSDRKAQQRAIGYLARRRFDAPTAYRAVDKIKRGS